MRPIHLNRVAMTLHPSQQSRKWNLRRPHSGLRHPWKDSWRDSTLPQRQMDSPDAPKSRLPLPHPVKRPGRCSAIRDWTLARYKVQAPGQMLVEQLVLVPLQLHRNHPRTPMSMVRNAPRILARQFAAQHSRGSRELNLKHPVLQQPLLHTKRRLFRMLRRGPLCGQFRRLTLQRCSNPTEGRWSRTFGYRTLSLLKHQRNNRRPSIPPCWSNCSTFKTRKSCSNDPLTDSRKPSIYHTRRVKLASQVANDGT